MALLHLLADWARRRGRRVLAVTVDHGLNPASRAWGQSCRRACAALGVGWTERCWVGDKPTTGLTAAARSARHALIADAAREAGARVVLMAHTADDIAESDWMRERGSTLGHLREWSPSPAWPQGRSLMLLRPMLEERREALRGVLAARGASWIEDPGNADVRFGRSRARSALAAETPQAGPSDALKVAASWHGHWWGGLEIERQASASQLAFALLCAAGTDQPPRGRRLEALHSRVSSPPGAVATLAGARVETRGDHTMLLREDGEFFRRKSGVAPVAIEPGDTIVWDGRFEIAAVMQGGVIVPAAGLWNHLSPEDGRSGSRVWPSARAGLPVLIRDDGRAPVLAWRAAEVRALAPRRLDLALSALGMGETTQESDLFAAVHGETPPTDLFSRRDDEPARVWTRRRGTEDRHESA